jgi:hypothetical protein
MTVLKLLNRFFFVVWRDVGILQGGLQIFMPHPLLHGPGTNPLHQGVRTKGMTELVQLDAPFDPCPFGGTTERRADIIIGLSIPIAEHVGATQTVWMASQRLYQDHVHGDTPGFVILGVVLLTRDHVQLSFIPIYIFPA